MSIRRTLPASSWMCAASNAPDEYSAKNRMVKCFLYDEETVGADVVAENIGVQIAVSQTG